MCQPDKELETADKIETDCCKAEQEEPDEEQDTGLHDNAIDEWFENGKV